MIDNYKNETTELEVTNMQTILFGEKNIKDKNEHHENTKHKSSQNLKKPEILIGTYSAGLEY